MTESGRAELILVLVIAYATASAFYPALRATDAKRSITLAAFSGIILASPLLIPSGQPLLRLVASLNATTLVVKLYDLHVDSGRAQRLNFAAFLIYLPNCFNLVLRKNTPSCHHFRWHECRRIVISLPILSSSVALAAIVFQTNWQHYPFILEHSVKVATVYSVVASAGVGGAAIWRLLGYRARELMSHPEFAPTPAEFWRRWNIPAQQFFYEDVFKQVGGFRSVTRATLLTFMINAVVHEYVFGIAVGRFQGYQAAFFLLNGCVVAATNRVKPTAYWQILSCALTLGFVLLSSVLFFLSVNAIVPFYDHDPAALWSNARFGP